MFVLQEWTDYGEGVYDWRTMQEFTNELDARRQFAKVKEFGGKPKIVVLDES